MKTIKGKTSRIEEAFKKQEAILNSHIMFIERISEPLIFTNKKVDSLMIEGETWIPAVLCDERVKSFNELKDKKWALVYFKDNGFIFPKELWERLSQSICIYGEIIPVNVSTEIGDAQFFIKVRCAAFV